MSPTEMQPKESSFFYNIWLIMAICSYRERVHEPNDRHLHGNEYIQLDAQQWST